MPQPLIVFIGGVPGMGKTSYAAHIAKEFGIGIVMSGDYLREFLKTGVQEGSDRDILRYSVYDAWQAFGEKTDENIIKGYLKQGEIVNRGMDALVHRAVVNGESVVIESLYFIPEQVKALKEDGIVKFYIYMSDAEKHRQRLLERSKYTHPLSPGDRLVREIATYRKIMDYSTRVAMEIGIKVFDSKDYFKTRDEIIEYVRSLR